jgi:hypothetical protein
MIPKEVMKAAKGLDDYKGKMILLGKYKGEDAYTWEFDEPAIIGLPEVYLWNGSRVITIKGNDALDIISLLYPSS